jgi:hypothetical protein
MGMRIDKTRQDHTAREIKLFGAARFPRTFDPPACSHRDNAIIMYEKSAVSDNSKLSKRATAPGYAAPKR